MAHSKIVLCSWFRVVQSYNPKDAHCTHAASFLHPIIPNLISSSISVRPFSHSHNGVCDSSISTESSRDSAHRASSSSSILSLPLPFITFYLGGSQRRTTAMYHHIVRRQLGRNALKATPNHVTPLFQRHSLRVMSTGKLYSISLPSHQP